MQTDKPLDLSKLNILVVDDDLNIIKIVRTLLRNFGIKRVDEAHDAAEAFEKLKLTSFDLVIVDYLMKPLDGIDFIRLVRSAKDSASPTVPIIMLTAYAEERRVKEARDAGVTEFLCKPVTASDLYQRLVSIVQRPRPFVRAGSYIGPCRRRRNDPNRKGPERRKQSPADDSSPAMR